MLTTMEQQRKEKQEQCEDLEKHMLDMVKVQTYSKMIVYPFLVDTFCKRAEIIIFPESIWMIFKNISIQIRTMPIFDDSYRHIITYANQLCESENCYSLDSLKDEIVRLIS